MSDTSSNETTHQSLGAYRSIPELNVLATVVDGASAVGSCLDTIYELVTEGSKLLSLSNQGHEYFNIRQGTDLYSTANVSLMEFKDISGALALQLSADPANEAVSLFGGAGKVIFIETSTDYSGATPDGRCTLSLCPNDPTGPYPASAALVLNDWFVNVQTAISMETGPLPYILLAPGVPGGGGGQAKLTTDTTKSLTWTAQFSPTPGASYVANIFDTVSDVVTSGAKLLSIRNFGVSKLTVDKDGNTAFKGLTTTGAQYVHRQDASLQMAIAAANVIRTILLAHAADGAEHFHDGGATPDTVNFAAMPVACTDLTTAKALIAYMLTGYAAHDTDAKAATPTYHNTQYAGSDLADASAPATLAECLDRLVDLQIKYNAHDADTTAHTTGSTHQDTSTIYSYSTVRDDYIVEVSDVVIAPSIILSTADCVDGRVIIIKDTSGGASGSNITVSTEAAELIDGEASYVISVDYDSLGFYSDGTNWYSLLVDPQP